MCSELILRQLTPVTIFPIDLDLLVAIYALLSLLCLRQYFDGFPLSHCNSCSVLSSTKNLLPSVDIYQESQRLEKVSDAWSQEALHDINNAALFK